MIWQARNEEKVRIQMAHTEPILWESHLKFVDSLSVQYKKIYMAVYREEQLLGSVNIEYSSATHFGTRAILYCRSFGEMEMLC